MFRTSPFLWAKQTFKVSTLPSPSFPSPSAFALVRKLLSERPRHFQEILNDGIESFRPSASSSSSTALPLPTSPSEPSSVTGNVKPGKKTKGKSFSNEGVNMTIVPSDHPFISARYLKKRILPILESQNAIFKKLAPLGNEGDKKQFLWHLSTPASMESTSRPSKPATDASAGETHFNRLLSNHKANVLSTDPSINPSEVVPSERELYGDRSEREYMAWEGRKEGLSTRLERLHLNSRRQKARAGKEWKKVVETEERNEVMRGARDQVRREKGEVSV